eukprot:gene16284-22181_t
MKPLSRALTFDERGIKAEFKPLSKRSQTFVESRSIDVPKVKDPLPNDQLMVSDVIYRRYFGMEDDMVIKIPQFLNRNNKSRSNSMVNLSDISLSKPKIYAQDAVIIVDTFSTGAMLADIVYKMGYKVICVLSGDLKDLLEMIPEGLDFSFVETFVCNVQVEPIIALETLLSQIQSVSLNIVAVIAGAETGVELADMLSESLNLRTNGTALSEARRNKYVMGETIRAAGIRAVKQLRASTWGEIEKWINEWNPTPFKVIVKPVDSAGSDDVTLCHSIGEVQSAFGNIMGKINGLGIVNRAVLVQEYLEGLEYVVDIVSKDGVHKVVAMWVYDRRPANGAGFVCFGQRILSADEPNCAEIIEYQKKVITALGIKNGPTHGEVKWFNNEPVLVEVGARCHGGDGLWIKISDECFGFNQAQSTVDAYLNPEKFNLIPNVVRVDTI